MLANDGFNYERNAIVRWIAKKKNRSPWNATPMADTLITNNALRLEINEFLEIRTHPHPE